MSAHKGLIVIEAGNSKVDTSSPSAWQRIPRCPHCGDAVNAAVVALTNHNKSELADLPRISWARCTACHQGIVINDDTIAPPQKAGQNVKGLQGVTSAAYMEARECAGIGAFTASELMCRKVLMHVAAEKGAQEGGTFASYIDFLVKQGYVTPPMKPWVAHIRTRGNIATHEIPASSEAEALSTLEFTAQLLISIFEMEHRMKQYLVETDVEEPDPQPDTITDGV